MRITFGERVNYNEYWIIAANNSKDWKIHINKYGYKTWDGEIKTELYQPVVLNDFLSSGDQEEFSFYDSVNGKHEQVNLGDVYYAYVEDSTGRIFKKYTYPRVKSWLIRFYHLSRRHSCF